MTNRELTAVDPLADVRAGQTDPTEHGDHCCNALMYAQDSRMGNDPWFCTRLPHPADWNHIAGDGEQVWMVWRSSIVSELAGVSA